MKRITVLIVLLASLIFLESCVREITPYKAASKGGLKCGKWRLK